MVGESEVRLIRNIIRAEIPGLTGGLYEAGNIESGLSARAPRKDWILIEFVRDGDGF